jgi:peptidoglycan/LPS O-acetylase OafA/YrhL
MKAQQREHQSPKQSALMKLAIGFSLYTNTAKLFRITNNADQLGCLNGIRYLSIGWVVLGHTYFLALSYVDNVRIAEETWKKRTSFQLVLNAFSSVDTFFLMR